MSATAECALVPAMNMARDQEFSAGLFAALRESTGDGVGITRESYGAGESLALDIMEKAARQSGLETGRDAGANLVVTLPGSEPDLPYLACGSHLDSVPQGGNYDGGAGVIAGLAILAGLKRDGFAPRCSAVSARKIWRRPRPLRGVRWPTACGASEQTSTGSCAESR
jgi:N-carbamoyl-L-amino-acid hydrolase